jgi:hypothetical protein
VSPAQGFAEFSADAIRSAEILEKKAKSVAEKTLNELLESGYGIFSGKADKQAILRFSPKEVRWAASEQWCPLKLSQFDKNMTYHIDIKYSNDEELVMGSCGVGRLCDPVINKTSITRSALFAVLHYHSI